ncbi:MAG: AAA family ATPase [Candidatus Korobacteraceae bacterium]|jgi:Ni2+-binding GTPase involved in maturation of urease and hydrogenase
MVARNHSVAARHKEKPGIACGDRVPSTPRYAVGNLLFLGPTGSGKTRVVKAMAESLFGDPHACIKIDCVEFQHSHEIAKLIGSPCLASFATA